MGNSTNGFVDYVKEQLAPIGELGGTRFFGGVGLVANGVQFGMVMDNALYFVVDADSRARYERQGSRCFSYETKKKRIDVKRYFEVPAPAIEESDALVALAQEAIAIARRSAPVRTKRR